MVALEIINIGTPQTDLLAGSVEGVLTRNPLTALLKSEPEIREEIVGVVMARPDGDYSLDVIDESDDGVITLSGLVMDGTGWTVDQKQRLLTRVRQIRLIGCETAKTPRGIEATLRFGSSFGIPVHGTSHRIGTLGFNAHGVVTGQARTSGELTIPVDFRNSTMITPDYLNDVRSGKWTDKWLNTFGSRPFRLDDVTTSPAAGAAISIDDFPFRLPKWATPIKGLLDSDARPVPVTLRGGRTITIDVLGNGELLRLHSQKDGWVYVNVPPGSSQTLLAALAPRRGLPTTAPTRVASV